MLAKADFAKDASTALTQGVWLCTSASFSFMHQLKEEVKRLFKNHTNALFIVSIYTP